MGMNKKQQFLKQKLLEGKIKILPESKALSICFIIGVLFEVLFLVLLLVLAVLPFKYVVAIIAVLFVVDWAILHLLHKRHSYPKRIIGLIVLMLVMNVLLIGDSYVYSTYETLQKISKFHDTWEIYDVVALKGGSYNTIDDAKGKTIAVVDMESKQLIEAKERLVTGYDVKYDEKTNMIDVGRTVLSDDGQKQDNLIMVTRPNHKMINKQIKGFKANTQTIYSMKVRKRADDNAKRIDVTEESFNVLISGKDVWGDLKDKDGLSDVNMVMTVNPKTKEILLTSIPRDSYVPLHTSGQLDKLTHTGIYGEDETRQTIEDFLDIDINYSITVNFSMLRDIVDAIDGIDVYSDYSFKSAISEYEYVEGWNHLMGKPALYFARERKAFAEGDMQRNKNQQKVLKATIHKVTSSKVILTRYTSILDAVDDEMYTDMSDSDLKKLVRLTLRNMDANWKVHTVNIKGGTGMAPCYSMGNMELSCVFPSDESVEKAKEAIHRTMYPVDNTIQTETTTQTESTTQSESTTQTEPAEE